MLTVDKEFIRYEAPPVSSTGTVRQAPSFIIPLSDVKIIGYAPRVIMDDESDFVVLVSSNGQINYFNLDVVGTAAPLLLEEHFGYCIREQVPAYSFEETNWHTFILYPSTLFGQTLFRKWSWFTPRGFVKNMGKHVAMDNPMWEQLTDEASAYLLTVKK
ncbi:hypothetical protein [Hymenobacter glacialis]|uniref:Uncharacterized protein n=1 Tax=Hymenobacter glacialis TaxID=1908236 RepID=A0A1G1T196_9BACT|nr:hypothetical protein [Hymenobacter glacialis]OGX84649.1 hypothetical protein BEN48_02610 [Hymenobacter glacialis]